MPSCAAPRSLVAALLLTLGCSSNANSNPPAGSEGGACYPNATCDAGLVCASELCVFLPEGTSGGSAEGNGSRGSSADGNESPDDGGDGGDGGGESRTSDGDAGEETGASAGETEEGSDESAGPSDSDSDSCPFSIDRISCASFCEADLYYSEVCNNGGATTSYEECFEACEYTVSNDLLDESPIGIEWYGCMQQTGGACDEFLDCFYSTSC